MDSEQTERMADGWLALMQPDGCSRDVFLSQQSMKRYQHIEIDPAKFIHQMNTQATKQRALSIYHMIVDLSSD